jgi:uridylate kinase
MRSNEREVAGVPRYRRVVVKLSGEALAGSAGSGVDPASLAHVATEVLSVCDLGVQVAVVVGGGNYFRGRMADGWGISRAEAALFGARGRCPAGGQARCGRGIRQ